VSHTIQISPLVLLRAPNGKALDAVASVAGLSEKQLVFVPGRLPCGECGACRRGFVSACLAPNPWLEAWEVERARNAACPAPSVGNRYVYEFDGLDPHSAAAAGLAARVIESAGRAGMTAGHVAAWLGDSDLAAIGAAWTARRGCRTVLIGSNRCVPSVHTVETVEEAVRVLADFDSEAPTGFCERHVFIAHSESSRTTEQPASDILTPGTTVTHLQDLGGHTASADESAAFRAPWGGDTRHFIAGAHYHPDFVPEGLAAISDEDFRLLEQTDDSADVDRRAYRVEPA